MTLQEFNTMQQQVQLRSVFSKGVYIGERKEKKTKIVLYEIDDICVELYYTKSESKPKAVKSFICTETFELSLREIA